MPPRRIINASQAHKMLIRQGYEMSYPTAIKWLRENGLSKQDTRYHTIAVDEDLLIKFLQNRKSKIKPGKPSNRKPPGRKKGDG